MRIHLQTKIYFLLRTHGHVTGVECVLDFHNVLVTSTPIHSPPKIVNRSAKRDCFFQYSMDNFGVDN